jgi:hypothetical protein
MDKARTAQVFDYVEAYLNGFDWLDYYEKQSDTEIGKLYSKLMRLCRIHSNLYKLMESDFNENDIVFPSKEAYQEPGYLVYKVARNELSLLTKKLIEQFIALGEIV